jgi:hypothetical protein
MLRSWPAERSAVPTHRDFPWERDERAERRRTEAGAQPIVGSTTAPTWRPIPDRATGRGLTRSLSGLEIAAALGVCGVLIFAKTQVSLPAVVSPPSSAPTIAMRTPPPAMPVVHTLHSRLVSTTRIQIWGTVNGPDGTTVRLSLKARGARARPITMTPAARGHFYASTSVPRSMRGRRLTVIADVTS